MRVLICCVSIKMTERTSDLIIITEAGDGAQIVPASPTRSVPETTRLSVATDSASFKMKCVDFLNTCSKNVTKVTQTQGGRVATLCGSVCSGFVVYVATHYAAYNVGERIAHDMMFGANQTCTCIIN